MDCANLGSCFSSSSKTDDNIFEYSFVSLAFRAVTISDEA